MHSSSSLTKPDRLQEILKTPFAGPFTEGRRETLKFELAGLERQIHFVREDNLSFFEEDVDLVFYFHRRDSWGEGGSGQQWDSIHIVDLGQKVPISGSCHVLTDGTPDGVHSKLLDELQISQIRKTRNSQKYYYGTTSGEFLRKLVISDKTREL